MTRRTRNITGRLALCLAAAAPVASCVVDRGHDEAAADAAADSLVAAPAAADSPAAAGSAVPGAAGADAAPPSATPRAVPPAGVAPVVPAGAPPAAAMVPAAELEALAAVIVVPVEGIARKDLRDSYLEARGQRVHQAIDILAPRGTPVLSATDGTLLRLFDSRAGGLMVYAADVTGKFILYYGHLDAYADSMANGMALKRGQVIGYVGTTGNAPPDTPHLHFGILRGRPQVSWSTGTPVNPYPILRGLNQPRAPTPE